MASPERPSNSPDKTVAQLAMQLPFHDRSRYVPRDIAGAGEEMIIAVTSRIQLQQFFVIAQEPLIRHHAAVADHHASGAQLRFFRAEFGAKFELPVPAQHALQLRSLRRRARKSSESEGEVAGHPLQQLGRAIAKIQHPSRHQFILSKAAVIAEIARGKAAASQQLCPPAHCFAVVPKAFKPENAALIGGEKLGRLQGRPRRGCGAFRAEQAPAPSSSRKVFSRSRWSQRSIMHDVEAVPPPPLGGVWGTQSRRIRGTASDQMNAPALDAAACQNLGHREER